MMMMDDADDDDDGLASSGKTKALHDLTDCLGGPGMIFSRETLRRMVPNIKDCIKNLYSTHEDVEVCVNCNLRSRVR